MNWCAPRRREAELASAWKQWVLPGIDEDWNVRGYTDPVYASRWLEIYKRRIAGLEAAVAAQPEDDRVIDRLTLGYGGQSVFLARYGRTAEAIEVLRKSLVIFERIAMEKPNGVHFFFIANCVFEMAKLGADQVAELERMKSAFNEEAIQYIFRAIVHMQKVAERRTVNLTSTNQ